MAQITFTNAGGITAQSTITATDFVGNLPTSYLTSTTSTPAATSIYMKDKGIYIWSNNADVDIWHIDGDNTGWNNSYGFNLLYKGTQSGNDNDLILYAHNQSSVSASHVEVYRVHQDGQFIFKSTPKVGTTNVSLVGHTHNYAGSASAGGPATDFVAVQGTDNIERYVYFASSDSTYNPASAASAAKGRAAIADSFKFNPGNGRLNSKSLALTSTGDVTASAVNSDVPLIIGTSTGEHLEMDGNEIMAKTNGSTVGVLYLNYEGGQVDIGAGGLKVRGDAQATGKYLVGSAGAYMQYTAATESIDFNFA